jgi:hypothetical protein
MRDLKLVPPEEVKLNKMTDKKQIPQSPADSKEEGGRPSVQGVRMDKQISSDSKSSSPAAGGKSTTNGRQAKNQPKKIGRKDGKPHAKQTKARKPNTDNVEVSQDATGSSWSLASNSVQPTKHADAKGVASEGVKNNGGKPVARSGKLVKQGKTKAVDSQGVVFDKFNSPEAKKQRKFVGRMNLSRKDDRVTWAEFETYATWAATVAEKLNPMVCVHCKKVTRSACACSLPKVEPTPEPSTNSFAALAEEDVSLTVADETVTPKVAKPPIAVSEDLEDEIVAAPTQPVERKKLDPIEANRLFNEKHGYSKGVKATPPQGSSEVAAILVNGGAPTKRSVISPDVGPNCNLEAPVRVERKAGFLKRVLLRKKKSQFNYSETVNHEIGSLIEHKAELRRDGPVVPDSLIIKELFVYLRFEMHTSYASRAVKLEHAHKLTKKWVEREEREVTALEELNRIQVTIQKAVDALDSTYNYAETNEQLGRYNWKFWQTSARTQVF